MPPILSLRNISKAFPGVQALDDVSIDLPAGQVTALIGENGAGKSTIVKILTGIYAPDEGDIHVDDSPARFHSPRDAWAAGIAANHNAAATRQGLHAVHQCGFADIINDHVNAPLFSHFI